MVRTFVYIAAIALLAVIPSASAMEFAFNDAAPTQCATVADHSLVVGSHVSGAQKVTITASTPKKGLTPASTGSTVFAAAPIATTTKYDAEAWTVVVPKVETGTGSFTVTLGKVNTTKSGCSFVAVTGAVRAVSGPAGATVVLTPTVGAWTLYKGTDQLALKITDSTEALGAQAPTVLHLEYKSALGFGTYSTSPALNKGYPVPGPASFIVMALGAVCVALWVRKVRVAA